MDVNWTPGSKKHTKATDDLDDLLEDLLEEDVSPPKRSVAQPSVGRDLPHSRKQSPKDDNFYSNLAAMADDDLSDVSEADVRQVAKSIADLDDMDADLFGGKMGKKNSLKGESSGKGSTPRRTGTPRSRNTTPRSISPHARVASPTSRVLSPVGRASTPTRSETQTGVGSRPGSGKRRTGVKSPPPLENKPGTAPGKLTDISSMPESLKPGQIKTQERPETAPKLKPKYDFGEFDENDPLAGLLSSDEESPPTRAGQKPVLKQRSSKEELVSPRRGALSSEATLGMKDSSQKKSLFDRPPTRSGSNRSGEADDNSDSRSATPVPKQAVFKKKEESLFSDDDEFLGGLGIDDNKTVKPSQAKRTEMEEEDKPAHSIMDQLLGKDSVSKHLEAKERHEFILDQKYSENKEKELPSEDSYTFGGYQPTQASGSRPSSRRSVRFQDEEDAYGFNKSQGDPSSMNSFGGPTFSTQTNNALQMPIKSPSSKPKSDPFDWLGLKTSEEENDEFEWLKTKTAETATRAQQKTQSSRSDQAEKAADGTVPAKAFTDKDSDRINSSKSKSSDRDQMSADSRLAGNSMSTQDENYLGLGQEIDASSILRSKPDPPTFQGVRGVTDQAIDLFSSPANTDASVSPFWQSGIRGKANASQQPIEASQDVGDFTQKQLVQTSDSHTIPAGDGEFLHFDSNDKQHGLRVSQDRPLISPDPVSFSTTVSRPPVPSTSTQSYPSYSSIPPADTQPVVSQQELLKQHQQFIQQQQQLQQMVENMQRQYQASLQTQAQTQTQVHTQMPLAATASQMFSTDSPGSQMELQAKVWKLEMVQKHSEAVLQSTQKRYTDEIQALEESYKSRIQIIEESHQNRERSWQEERDQLLSRQLSRISQLEQEKCNIASSHYKKLEEFEMEKSKEFEKVKVLQSKALEDLRKEYDDGIQRLKLAKDQQIDVVANSHDTTRYLHAAVELIQTNARDLGELQKKVDGWHSMGLDDREISIRAKDEQLKILQERLNKQQDENNRERKRLEELISRMEIELREQTRMLDEERWKVKQEQCRMQSMQSSLEEERKFFNEQQARERANIDKTRESLLEEQKSILAQLHRERQALAEERVEFDVKQRMLKDENEQYTMKNAQAKIEYEATMKTLFEEKAKQTSRKEEFHKEVERIDEERRKIDIEMSRLHAKEEELIETVTLLRERSEEVDDIYMASQQKYEEGMAALDRAQQYHADKAQREMNIHNESHALRTKEKEISAERLRLSKDKKEMENLKSKLLCPNCRLPVTGQVIINQNIVPISQQNVIPSHVQMAVASPRLVDNSVVNVTESIKSDRTIRMWKMEAAKDQKYLEEQSMFLYSLKHMPYNIPS